MGDRSKIEWTDASWNPVRGCSPMSAGCTNCYAARQAHRFSGPGKPYEDLTGLTKRGPVWLGTIKLMPEILDQPLRWRKPRRVFVCSMSDLFHEAVPNEYIDRVFAIMALCPQHTFQVLTKRPRRALAHLSRRYLPGAIWDAHIMAGGFGGKCDWPLPNVWLGVSVENQKTADERIPHLLQTPAAVRFVSAEPLLGPVKFGDLLCGRSARGFQEQGINWCIVGGESGPGARCCEVSWIRSIVEQCREAKTPCFVKQDSGPKPGKQGRIQGDLWGLKEFPDGA